MSEKFPPWPYKTDTEVPQENGRPPLLEGGPLQSSFDILSPPRLSPPRRPTGHTVTDFCGSRMESDGRTYQSYAPAAYMLPNDGDEQERLDMQHQLYLILLDNELTTAEIDTPGNVLDVGTGTGIWAWQFARRYPQSRIIGTDLSLIQPHPPDAPQNVKFWRQNAEKEEWVSSNGCLQSLFDFVHIRDIGPCFDDISRIVWKAYDYTTPGGWVELADVSWEIQCDDSSLQGTYLETFVQRVVMGAVKWDRDMIKAKFFKQYLTNAGFLNVKEQKLLVPLTAWPTDPKFSHVGSYASQVLFFAVESYRSFLAASGLQKAAIDELSDGAKRELRHKGADIHAYFYAYFACGQKPRGESRVKQKHL